MTAALKVTYGSYTVGPSGSCTLDGGRPFTFEEDYDKGDGRLEFDAVVAATTTAAFKTACDSFEAAFALRDVALVVTYSSTATVTITPSTRTRGFDTRAKWNKPGSDVDTGLSRGYHVVLTWRLPATGASDGGFRDYGYRLTYTPARIKTLTVFGTVTGSGSTNAMATYQSGIASIVTAIQALPGVSFTGTTPWNGWESAPESEEFTPGRNANELRFQRVYRELVLKQNSSTLDDTTLSGQQITVNVKKTGPGDSSAQAKRPTEVTIGYGVFVLIDTSAQSDAQSLAYTKWASTIQPWLITHASTLAGSSRFAVMEDSPRYNEVDRRIEATLRLWFFESDLLESHIRVRTSLRPNDVLEPAWDGDKIGLARILYPGPVEDRITRTERSVYASSKGRTTSSGSAGSTLGFNFGNSSGTVSLFEPFSVDFVDRGSGQSDTGGFGISAVDTTPTERVLEDSRETVPIVWGVSPNQVEGTEITTVLDKVRVKLLGSPKPRQRGTTGGGQSPGDKYGRR